jgi:hypothetical protein
MYGGAPLGSITFGGIPQQQLLTDWLEDLSVYFPLELRNTLEQDYFQKQLNSFIANQNTNNDYALLALHQLFMFCSYGLLYGALRDKTEVTKHSFTLANVRPEERLQLAGMTSPLTFSLLNERTFFDALSFAECDTRNDMKPLKELVDYRNDLAHCNGVSSSDLNEDVGRYIKGFEIVHKKFTSIIASTMIGINGLNFVVDEQIQLDELANFFGTYYISQRMLELSLPSAKAKLQKNANKLIDKYMLER